jgi:RNAse (barnase) inhibitor barstar
MTIFTFKGKKLTDWKSFHKEFKRVMDFPDYYGENMNA